MPDRPGVVKCKHCGGSGTTSRDCCRIAAGVRPERWAWGKSVDRSGFRCCACGGAGNVRLPSASCSGSPVCSPHRSRVRLTAGNVGCCEMTECRHCRGSGRTRMECCRPLSDDGSRAPGSSGYECCACQGTRRACVAAQGAVHRRPIRPLHAPTRKPSRAVESARSLRPSTTQVTAVVARRQMAVAVVSVPQRPTKTKRRNSASGKGVQKGSRPLGSERYTPKRSGCPERPQATNDKHLTGRKSASSKKPVPVVKERNAPTRHAPKQSSHGHGKSRSRSGRVVVAAVQQVTVGVYVAKGRKRR